MFEIKTKMLTPNKYSRPGTKLNAVKGIIIHWTANEGRGADAYANINFFENRKHGKTGYGSAHYFVDSKQIVQCLPNNELAYHVGATKYKTKKYGAYPNNCTLGIEMCVNADGKFSTVYQQTVELTASLMKRYGLNPDTALDRHFDITGKNCPAMFTSSHWGATNHSYAVKYGLGSNADTAWTVFKQQVKKAMNGSTFITPTVIPAAADTRSYLANGDKGPEVKKYQELLTKAGYTLGADGIFGAGTKAAVIQFQKDSGLLPDGIIGAATKKKLEDAVAAKAKRDYLILGDRGDEVRLHQDKFTRAGYPLKVDGIYGEAMKKVVTQFQKEHKLEPDGVHGAATQKKLNDVLIALRTKPTKEEVIAMLKDIAGHSLEKNIQSLYDKKITVGDEKGNFNPNDVATRAHVAAFLDRTIDYIINHFEKK